jgi:hypothetical protein
MKKAQCITKQMTISIGIATRRSRGTDEEALSKLPREKASSRRSDSRLREGLRCQVIKIDSLAISQISLSFNCEK